MERDQAPVTQEEWSEFLAERLDCPVGVVFGRSLSYPIQVRAGQVAAGQVRPVEERPRRLERRRPSPGLVVRMHSMFTQAPPEVAESVASWIRSGRRARRACTLLDAWIERRMAESPARPPRRTQLSTAGEVHDLEALAAPLLRGPFAEDFHGRPVPSLTWGRRGRSRTRRSLRLGSFDVEANLVRIHRVLDQRAVPAWFVRYVLFHEILHAVHPPVREGNRWIHHGREFRRREKLYPDYPRALEWEEENLPRLIRSARSGVPARVRPTDLQPSQATFDF